MEVEEAYRQLGDYSNQVIALRHEIFSDEYATAQERETIERIGAKIRRLNAVLSAADDGTAPALPDFNDLLLHVRIRARSQ